MPKEIKKSDDARLPPASSSRFELARFAFEKTNQLIICSTNEENSTCKQLLMLGAVRLYTSDEKYKKLKDFIFSLNLNLHSFDYFDFYLKELEKSEAFQDLNLKLNTLGEIKSLIPATISPKQYHKDGSPVTSLERIENSAKNAALASVGNCGERASIAFVLLQECIYTQNFRAPIHSCFLNIGDHAFVLIGEIKEKILNKPELWPKDIILVDPWYEEFGYTKELIKKDSLAMNHILEHKEYIVIEESSYIGAGHSNNWKERCAKNQRSEFLFQWETRKNSPESECIPFKRKQEESEEISNNKKIKSSN